MEKNGKNGRKKFLFVSNEALIGDLAWEIKKEGHEVKYCIIKEDQKDICDGFVDKVDSWKEHTDWADVIVFDDSEFGEIADRLRKEGKVVVGGSSYTDKLEISREFGQEEMKKAGMATLPNWNFTDFNGAVKFIKESPGRYVIKPSGLAQNEKELLFIGQEDDGKDVIQVLEHYKKNWSNKIKLFQLQKYASGVEVAIGAFFNGEDFITPVNVNFEHKRMFPGEIGPSTGEMGCYDEKTEVLTKEGWKFFANISYDDEICTLNPSCHFIEFHKPSNIVCFSHHKKLVSVKNQTLDIMVTPDHNMYVNSQWNARNGSDKFEFVRARNLQNQSVIKRTGRWIGIEQEYFVLPSVTLNYRGDQVLLHKTPEIEIPMDVWTAFMGIWVSDGYTSEGYKVGIAQKNEEKTKLIEELLKNLPFGFSKRGGEFYAYNKQLYSYLKDFGKAPDKRVPSMIKELSPRQIEIFLKWFALGDGIMMKNGFRIFYTSSGILADDIQELLLKIGRIGIVKARKREGSIWIENHFADRSRVQYEVLERIKKLDSWIDKRDIQMVGYEGKVYCATVENHIMYVRRNGKPYWCGNTSMYYSQPNTIFNQTLLKMKENLADSGYVGYIDINCIVNSKGIYPLEFTSRFGYPHISIAMEGVLSPWGEFLHSIASRQKYDLKVKRGFQLGVVVAVPPFPFNDPEAFKRYSEDAVILFKKPNMGGVHPCDVKLVDNDWRLAGTMGYSLVVTGSGSTMDAARKQAYHRVKNIMIPNMFYRTDIGLRWYYDSDKLQTWGYIY
ncbi:MAG: hypothetical protein HYT73_03885 [Candidatus Aenigmarchaeota archaeon]|nr:hypothetical protein [Candidatus Aenigmarchaeota archaeon]